MYEDEEGRWQNRIEELWVAIDDRARLRGSRTSAFFNKVAGLVTRGFNRVFGRRLFSFQLIGVSSAYSFAGMFLYLPILLTIVLQPRNLVAPVPGQLLSAVQLIEYFCTVVGAICFLLAAMPSLWPSPLFVSLSLLPGLIFTAGLIKLIQLHRPFQNQLGMFIALLVSFLSDVIVLALVRFTVRKVSAIASVSKIVLAILIQVCVLGLLVVAPYEIAPRLMVRFGHTPALQILFVVAIFNAFTGLASSIFLFVLLFVLLHKVLWPALGKLLYPLARHQIIRNHKIMASVGTASFIFAFPLMWTPVKGALEWLAK
jgi:hypothetical protein